MKWSTVLKVAIACFVFLALVIGITFSTSPKMKEQLLAADWGKILPFSLKTVGLMILGGVAVVLIMAPFIKADERRKERDSKIVKTRLVSSDRLRSRTTGVGVYMGAGVSVGTSRTRHDDEHTYFVYYENGEVKTERVIAGGTRDRFLMDRIEK